MQPESTAGQAHSGTRRVNDAFNEVVIELDGAPPLLTIFDDLQSGFVGSDTETVASSSSLALETANQMESFESAGTNTLSGYRLSLMMDRAVDVPEPSVSMLLAVASAMLAGVRGRNQRVSG